MLNNAILSISQSMSNSIIIRCIKKINKAILLEGAEGSLEGLFH